MTASILLALLVLVTGACGSEGSKDKIAFSAQVDDVSWLLIVNADGSGEPTVAPGPSRVDYRVAWSPDGSHIAFRDSDSKSTYRSAVRADGTHYARLYDDQNIGSASIWSGKGHQFAYVRPDVPAIFVVNPDGSGRRKLVDGDFPSWSPDGRKIAFFRCPFVRVINSDGTGERKLVPYCEDDANGYIDFAWASDSRKIAYTTFAWKNPRKTCESDGSCDYINPDTNVGLCLLHIAHPPPQTRAAANRKATSPKPERRTASSPLQLRPTHTRGDRPVRGTPPAHNLSQHRRARRGPRKIGRRAYLHTAPRTRTGSSR